MVLRTPAQLQASRRSRAGLLRSTMKRLWAGSSMMPWRSSWRSEEHTSELQSRQYLVCRLLLEKKKKTQNITFPLPNVVNKKTYNLQLTSSPASCEVDYSLTCVPRRNALLLTSQQLY